MRAIGNAVLLAMVTVGILIAFVVVGILMPLLWIISRLLDASHEISHLCGWNRWEPWRTKVGHRVITGRRCLDCGMLERDEIHVHDVAAWLTAYDPHER